MGEYQIDPLFRERHERYRRYEVQNAAVDIKESKALLHLTKLANEQNKEKIVEGAMDLTVKENNRYNMKSYK